MLLAAVPLISACFASQVSAMSESSRTRSIHPKTDRWAQVSRILDVEYAKGLVHCRNGVRNDPLRACRATSLTLDVYMPGNPGKRLRPAYIIAHGGGNRNGGKSTGQVSSSAKHWATHGYVAFSLNYRLEDDFGTYPGKDFKVEMSRWSSLYPAVRDVKAAIRYVHANAAHYNIDTERIVVAGASAGAMNVLAAATTAENSFTSEISLKDDPTLATCNLNVSARVSVIVMRWGSDWGVRSYRQYLYNEHAIEDDDPLRLSTDVLLPKLPAVIQFHGENDLMIGHGNASALDEFLERAGANHDLHTLAGAGHGAWNAGCPHPQAHSYCSKLDRMAMKFIRQDARQRRRKHSAA